MRLCNAAYLSYYNHFVKQILTMSTIYFRSFVILISYFCLISLPSHAQFEGSFTSLKMAVQHENPQEVYQLKIQWPEKIQPSILKFTQLKALDLSNYPPKKLPTYLSQLSQLESLSLSQQITPIEYPSNWSTFKKNCLPPWIFQLKNLKALYLDGCMIYELPAAILNWQQLEILDLSFTQLRSIPAILGGYITSWL